jgi:hypothetical protein
VKTAITPDLHSGITGSKLVCIHLYWSVCKWLKQGVCKTLAVRLRRFESYLTNFYMVFVVGKGCRAVCEAVMTLSNVSSNLTFHPNGLVAQLVERGTEDPGVGGSNPPQSTVYCRVV